MLRHVLPAFAVCVAVLLLGTPAVRAQGDPTGSVSPTAVTSAPLLHGTLHVNGLELSNLQQVSATMQAKGPDAAYAITDNNGLDEVYVTDQYGRMYVAWGEYTNLDQKVKNGFRGTVGDAIVDVVHVNNENNTATEGALSGIDDLKDLFKTVAVDNFGKFATGAGLTVGGLFARQLLLHPIAEETMLTALRVAAPIVGQTLLRTSVYGLAAAAAWPIAKALWNIGKRWYLDSEKKNPYTISMVTADNAQDLNHPAVMHPSQHQEGGPGDVIGGVLRKVDPPAGSGAPVTGEPSGGRRAAGNGRGTGSGAGTGTGSGTGSGTGTGQATGLAQSPGVQVFGRLSAPPLGSPTHDTGPSFTDLPNRQ